MREDTVDAASSTSPDSPVFALRERIDAWRKVRPKPRCRMPEDLWRDVVALARVQGLHSVARALKVDYYSLKERMGSTCDTGNGKKRAAFVEVAVNPSMAPAGECVVELERPDGSRMTIRTTNTADLVALGELFWRKRA